MSEAYPESGIAFRLISESGGRDKRIYRLIILESSA